jgi:hypothetical protein
MSKVTPLTGAARARYTLAQKLTRRVDRIRQLNTRFGLRARRVYLVWTKWTGDERGEGFERPYARRELLPTPKVSDASAVRRNPRMVGIMPEGGLRLTEVSAGAFTRDNLLGLVIPVPEAAQEAPRPVPGPAVGREQGEPVSDPHIDFFYEVVEDGRGDEPAKRQRFRPLAEPWRREGGFNWEIDLERADQDEHRDTSTAADDLDVFG